MRPVNWLLCAVLLIAIAAAEEPKPPSDAVSANAPEQTSESTNLPIYPGARVAAHDTSRRPIAVSNVAIASLDAYQTRDSAEQVLEFYRRELAHHGEVLECRSGKPVNPSALRRGLACDRKQSRGSVVLKSGGSRNLFAVIVDAGGNKKTSFTLIRALSSKPVGLARH